MIRLFLSLFAPVAAAHPGLAALREGDCVMCHEVPGLAAPERTGSCVACHVWVKKVSASPPARTAALQAFPKWERYERNVASYFAVPDLAAAAARLDPAWITRYLHDPYDLRPAMDETMVRGGLDPSRIDAIAAWAESLRVPVPATPPPNPANLPEGEALFGQRGCGACHSFGRRVAGAGEAGAGLAAAPDLQHARDRMTDDAIVAWILDPMAISPRAAMPNLGVSRADAIALRDYLVLADFGGSAPAPLAPLPAAVSRPVRYEEVEERVFGKICVHCHMDPAQNEGRAGPGNAGGFGWPATGIELQTYASVRDHGPVILAALQRRREEAARDRVRPGETPAEITRPEKPGMPLGLPPIPDDDIALVRAWYAQGAPR